MKEFFLIDSHAFLYRNYFALKGLATSKGEEVGALYGFIKLLLKIKEKSDYIVACYDSKKNLRKEIFASYKANRKKIDDALIKQIELSKFALSELEIKILEYEGYEADDLIAALSKKILGYGFSVVIVGGDKDLMQIVCDKIKIWDGKSDEYFDENYVEKKYGLKPKELLDYFSLIGDSSDNINGVRQIGPKTAVKLIKKYGNIEAIIESNDEDKNLEKVKKNADNAILAKKLISLNDKIEIDFKPDDFFIKEFSKKGLMVLAKRFEFRDFEEFFSDEMKDSKNMQKVDKESFLKNLNYVSISDKYISSENFYIDFDRDFGKGILLDDKIHKHCYNIKSIMHLCDCECVNFDDIYIAYHLVYGGFRKPEIERIIKEKFFVKPVIDSSYFKDVMDLLERDISKYKMNDLYRIETEISKVLYSMEKNGMRVETDKLYGLLNEFETEGLKIKKEFYEKTQTDINLNSPKQVSDFIFKKLNLKLDEKYLNIYKTKTGGYSTSEEVLNILKPYNPEIIGLILSHREYSKMKSIVENLLKFVKNSKVHTNFDQTSTHTGRISSYDPNLQNIPLRGDNAQKIRKCFVAEEGFVLVSFDYSQIDLRVLAHLSQDSVLINAFRNNEDIHRKTASSIFGVNIKDVTDEMRKIAKVVNFAILYGQTPLGLSIGASISYEEAKKYIDSYFNEYKGVKKWIDETIIKARKDGYISNFMNRRRVIAEISSPNRAIRAQGERMAINMPVQSGSSDIIKKAMVEIYKIIEKENDIKLLLQIHDELLFEIKEGCLDKYKDKIKNIMENCFSLTIPLKVDIKIGRNWSDI